MGINLITLVQPGHQVSTPRMYTIQQCSDPPIQRVFLSANPLNIEVFRGITGHNKFHHRVTEIIWDEARLVRGPPRIGQPDEGNELLSDEQDPENPREWARNLGTMWQEEVFERHEFDGDDGCPK